MRLTEEQVLQDDRHYESCNVLAELKYCGWEIPHRMSITNEEIRFQAWLCRSAVALLKEQEAVKPEREYSGGGNTWWNVCGKCKTAINPNDKFCHECGKPVLWEGR